MPSTTPLVPLKTPSVTILITLIDKAISVVYILFIRLPLTIMSAVMNALSDALHPSPSSVAPHSSPSGQEKEAQGEADVSSSHLHSQTDDSNSSTSTKADNPASAHTREGTPHPRQTSASAAQRRVSISSALPLVATITPERGTRTLWQAEDDNHSHPSDSEDEGSEGSDVGHSSEPLLSPYHQVNANISIESKATSGSTGLTGSSFSTPAELQLGPQDLPFVLRRHAADHEHDASPSRLATTPFTPHFKGSSSARITIRPDQHDQLTSTPVSRPSIQASVYHIPLPLNLSSWRQDQIKTARPLKLMGGTVPRPISTLHGPLSLPYARNPSGVDATVADESAYMSHVFGLRAASGFAHSAAKAARSTSSGTQSSGTTGTGSRSTSGSSGILNASKSSQERSVLSEGSSYTSVGGTHHTRPLVIRDPNQNIGIKAKGPIKEGLTTTLTKDAKKTEGLMPKSTSAVNTASVTQASSDFRTNEADENKENIDPQTMQLRRRASETSLLDPKLGESVLGPSRSQVNLRGMTSLSPIPGSPAAEGGPKDPFHVLHDQALTKTAGVLTKTSHEFQKGISTEGMAPIGPGTESGGIRLPTYVPVYFNPTTMSYELAVSPQPASDDSYTELNTGHIFIPGTKAANNSPIQPSKADVSDNWRKKAAGAEASFNPEAESAIAAQTDRDHVSPPLDSHDVATDTQGVMTIDSLFEKFNHPASQTTEGQEGSIAVNPPSLSNPAKHAVLKYFGQPSRSNPVSPRKSHINVLGESSKALNAQAPPYTPGKIETVSTGSRKGPLPTPTDNAGASPSKRASTSAKGTPGAGKLLKKGAVAGEGSQETVKVSPPVVGRKGEGKAKVKGARK